MGLTFGTNWNYRYTDPWLFIIRYVQVTDGMLVPSVSPTLSKYVQVTDRMLVPSVSPIFSTHIQVTDGMLVPSVSPIFSTYIQVTDGMLVPFVSPIRSLGYRWNVSPKNYSCKMGLTGITDRLTKLGILLLDRKIGCRIIN